MTPALPSVDTALKLLAAGHLTSMPQLHKLLSADHLPDEPDSQYSPAALFNAAMTGFFHSGAVGTTFVDPALIAAKFGRTLEQNYPEAGNSFLKFAYTYWTLKLSVNDAFDRGDRSVAYQLLAQVEQMVAGTFFPTPGPIQFDPAQREATQRQVLAASGAPIDIEAFITGNPILIRDKRRQGGSGCGSVLLVTLASAATVLLT
jgi:hypothetical protein